MGRLLDLARSVQTSPVPVDSAEKCTDEVEAFKRQWTEARHSFYEASDDDETERAWREFLTAGDDLWRVMGAEAYEVWTSAQQR